MTYRTYRTNKKKEFPGSPAKKIDTKNIKKF